jgi:hypothetical protein
MKSAAKFDSRVEASVATARNGGSARLPPKPYGMAFADGGSSLIVGRINDPAEGEADALAERALAGFPVPRPRSAAAAIRRACSACAEEEQRGIRRKADGGGDAHGGHAAPAAVSSLLSRPGRGLDLSARRFFEGRFAQSFGDVAVHDGPAADLAARSIGARAFTAGRHIAFAEGQYAPGTRDGMRLLAHELTHVLQQRGGSPVIRRATYGSGALQGRNWIPPPAAERPHVDEAMAKIDAVVADPATFRECHEQYASLCPGGGQGTLATIWNRARIWRKPGVDPGAYAWAPTGGSDIAYTSLGYAQNATDLAATLMHEAGHNCGIPGGNTHWHAELVSNYCMTPGQNAFSISAGPSLNGGDPAMFLSYRRFLGDWAGGRLRATLGADFNFVGTLLEAGHPPGPHEYGSLTGGVQLRAGGWGGTRYGGISFRLETGVGVGRFAMPPATPGAEPPTEILPDVIMQVGPRAEFLIKTGDAHVMPLSVGAAYRLAQPLNSEASALHSALLTLETHF